MPKKVIGNVIKKIIRDIKANYSIGERYLSVREISGKFGVSQQTAQKVVAILREKGMVEAAPRVGITIIGLEEGGNIQDKKIIVISNQHEKKFNDAFEHGIRDTARKDGVSVEFYQNTYPKSRELSFGEYLLNFDADGIIALAFKNSDLPFYHAMREGLDIVSDIITDNLPTLPSVQTDNYRHARMAGSLLMEQGYRNFLVAGYYPQNSNKRYLGFMDGLNTSIGKAFYVCLRDLNAMSRIDKFFSRADEKSAVFSTDYSTNYILAAKFIQHNRAVQEDNFIVYDSEDDFFHYSGLPPIRSVAPSLKKLGEELYGMLITKWKTNEFPLPLQRKI